MASVLVHVTHAVTSRHTVHNVQPNHDNQLTGNHSPESCPLACMAVRTNTSEPGSNSYVQEFGGGTKKLDMM